MINTPLSITDQSPVSSDIRIMCFVYVIKVTDSSILSRPTLTQKIISIPFENTEKYNVGEK